MISPRKLRSLGLVNRRGKLRAVVLVAIAAAAATSVSGAAAPLILNHDDANRLIGASSAGSGSAQFNYDANGNVSSISSTSPTALTLGTAQTGQVSASRSAALFTFTTTTNQPALSLDLVSTSMSPAGSPVQVNVYNASGALVGSTTGSAGTLLNLPTLPAGTYSVSVEAQDAATGSFQVELINTPA